MTTRFDITLSNEFSHSIENAAKASQTDKSQVVRKALAMYLIAREGKDNGLKFGLIDPGTNEIKIEFVGL